ncbi:MAG: hypothetical protein WAZ18_07240 [Alphaproteobacteria bacterium]
MKMAEMTVKQWHDEQFLPWKKAVADVVETRKQADAKLQANIGQLQTVLALVMDGKTRSAVMAWNALQLHPALKDIRLGNDGDALTLVTTADEVHVVRVEEVVDGLERMLGERGI